MTFSDSPAIMNMEQVPREDVCTRYNKVNVTSREPGDGWRWLGWDDGDGLIMLSCSHLFSSFAFPNFWIPQCIIPYLLWTYSYLCLAFLFIFCPLVVFLYFMEGEGVVLGTRWEQGLPGLRRVQHEAQVVRSKTFPQWTCSFICSGLLCGILSYMLVETTHNV